MSYPNCIYEKEITVWVVSPFTAASGLEKYHLKFYYK